ncbi:unnamed protein product [Lepidochelys kempii]
MGRGQHDAPSACLGTTRHLLPSGLTSSLAWSGPLQHPLPRPSPPRSHPSQALAGPTDSPGHESAPQGPESGACSTAVQGAGGFSKRGTGQDTLNRTTEPEASVPKDKSWGRDGPFLRHLCQVVGASTPLALFQTRSKD